MLNAAEKPMKMSLVQYGVCPQKGGTVLQSGLQWLTQWPQSAGGMSGTRET